MTHSDSTHQAHLSLQEFVAELSLNVSHQDEVKENLTCLVSDNLDHKESKCNSFL